jgi:hypothetical protein
MALASQVRPYLSDLTDLLPEDRHTSVVTYAVEGIAVSAAPAFAPEAHCSGDRAKFDTVIVFAYTAIKQEDCGPQFPHKSQSVTFCIFYNMLLLLPLMFNGPGYWLIYILKEKNSSWDGADSLCNR